MEMNKALAANLKEIEREMEKSASEMKHVPWKRFEWKSLGQGGAKGVAKHLQEKHGLERSPTVVVAGGGGEEDGKKPKASVFSVSHERYTHEFWVEESRYRYLRSNGKSKVMFKDFTAMRTEFWRDFDKRMSQIQKRNKAMATKIRDDGSYEGSVQKEREKKEAQEKEDEENRANPPQEMPPPPETPPPEKKTPPSEIGGAGDASVKK